MVKKERRNHTVPVTVDTAALDVHVKMGKRETRIRRMKKEVEAILRISRDHANVIIVDEDPTRAVKRMAT